MKASARLLPAMAMMLCAPAQAETVDTVMLHVPADIGNLGFISPALGQPAALRNHSRMRSRPTAML